jgi:NAD(P)-dependent dehydrogenase (short-subunit alcohol dehydrogenase family)
VSSTYLSSGTPIEGAVALVTGGNRGFGRALVDELPERGAAKVYASSRSAQPQRDDDRIVPYASRSATKARS